MALKFSSGLLSSLGGYGQGGSAIPDDPRQRNLMQQMGVTNPLLQAFGQSMGQAFGGISPLEVGSQQDRAIKAYKEGKQGDAKTREDRAAQLEALGYVEQAEKLRAVNAQQQQEKGAMMQLIEAEKSGLIGKEERDTLLRGLGERTIDPSAAVSTIQRRQVEESRKAELVSNSMTILDNAKERGHVNDKEYETFKYQIENEGLYGQQLAAIIRTNIKEREESQKSITNLTKYGKALKLDKESMSLIEQGVVNSEAGVRALAKDDGVMQVPPSQLQWLQDNTDQPAVKTYLEMIPENGVVDKDFVIKVASVQDRIKNRQEAAERAAERSKKVIDKRAGGDLSKQDISLFETMYQTDDEVEAAVDSFLDGGFFGADRKDREALYVKAARAFPALPEDQAILSYIQQQQSGGATPPPAATGDDDLLSQADALVGG